MLRQEFHNISLCHQPSALKFFGGDCITPEDPSGNAAAEGAFNNTNTQPRCRPKERNHEIHRNRAPDE